jgi:FAD/FMN-containing dehydrogenase
MDIIAVMITYGGSNATICHGAGLHNKTLSDIVLKLEFVNAAGELQTVDSPEVLPGAAGCFGLAGIVTAITFRMDRMTWARFHPKKTLMADSIPRPGTDR